MPTALNFDHLYNGLCNQTATWVDDEQTGSNRRGKQGSNGVETGPFQNPSRNGTRERMVFQHPSRAILGFQNDSIMDDSRSQYL